MPSASHRPSGSHRPSDSYGQFAAVYDGWQALYPRAFSLAMAPRIAAAVDSIGAPTRVLADIACGTGTFALWWKRTRRSWRVYGTDLSPAMIRAARSAARNAARDATSGQRHRHRETGGAAAKREAPDARGNSTGKLDAPHPRFLVQDMRRLELPEPAGVVTCLFDSLNHLTKETDLARAFRSVSRALAPRGLFLFDLVDERAFPDVFTGPSILDGPGLFVGIDTCYREARGRGFGEARFTFFRAGRRGWQRMEFDIRERRWLRRGVKQLLAKAGLEILRVEEIDPYRSSDYFVPRTFWICRKRS